MLTYRETPIAAVYNLYPAVCSLIGVKSINQSLPAYDTSLSEPKKNFSSALIPFTKHFFEKKAKNCKFLPESSKKNLKGLVKRNVDFDHLETAFPCLLELQKPVEFSKDCVKSSSLSIKDPFTQSLYIEAFTKKTLFAELLKVETLNIHRAVENHSFVKALLDGTLTNFEYYSHLVDLEHIYEALEIAIRNALTSEPRLKAIYFKNLERSDLLKRDLNVEEFQGLKKEPSLAAIEYGKHLQMLSQKYPLLLISHAYTRYLGDLSGGMILKGFVEKKWPNAHHFFNFDALLNECSLTNSFELKNLFKTKMNSIAMTPKELDDSVKEASLAFTFAGSLFCAARSD